MYGAAAWWWWPGGVVDGGREGQRDREGEAGEWGGRYACVSGVVEKTKKKACYIILIHTPPLAA